MSNFTNSPLATLRRLSTRNSNVPRNQPITKITPHHAAGVINSQNLLSWGHNPACQGSWHYGIGKDGIIHQLIDEANRPWTSSSAWNDNRAITFEVGNSTVAPNWAIGNAAWSAMINLMVDVIQRNPGITQRNGQPGLWFDNTQNGSLTFHDMFANTLCPGPFLRSRAQQICDEVNARLRSAPIKPNPTPAPTPDRIPGAADSSSQVHIIRSGDTFWSLSRAWGVTVAEIERANPGVNANSLQIGQRINRPGIAPNISAGREITMRNVPLFASANGAQVGTRSGTFWIYSSEVVNNRIRITNARHRVGATPIAQNVTGWVRVSDL